MKRIKRILTIFLVVVLLCTTGLITAASAATDQGTKAKVLFSLGLFQGYDASGTNFGLPDKVTREQALTFLIRMLGKDEEAKVWSGPQPYSDVPTNSWAYPYIGYAKEKGYTQGVGNNQFGMGKITVANEMTTFVLRGLGYSDATNVQDFNYNTSLTFAKKLGILESDQPVSNFVRGSAVDILFGALGTSIKGSPYVLITRLEEDGAVTVEQLRTAMALLDGPPTSTPTPSTTPKSSAVTGIKLDQTAITLNIGATKRLTGTITPSTATNKNLTWSSATPTIAKVDADGVVTGVKAGTATITCKTVDGGKTATCKVTVADPEKVIKSNVMVLNGTGKSISELYITDSDLSQYDSDLIEAGGYASLSPRKSITVIFEFTKATSFDIFVRYVDGSEAEATGLSFAKGGTSGNKLTISGSTVKLEVNGKAVASVALKAKATDTAAANKALTTRFNAAVKRWNTLMDQCIALGLDKDAAFVKSINEITAAINTMTKPISAGNLTAAKITEYNKDLDALDKLMNQMDADLKSGSDTTAGNKTLTTRFNAAVKRWNTLMDQCVALGLDKDTAFVKSINEITAAINTMTKPISAGNLTAAKITEYNKDLDALDKLMNQMDADLKSGSDTTAVNKTLTTRFNAAVKRWNALTDQCVALGLDKDAAFVKSINEITAAINTMTKPIGAGNLTAAKIAEYNKELDTLDTLMNQMDADLKKAAEKENKPTAITVNIKILNKTGVDISAVYMTEQKTSNWGTSLGSIASGSTATTSVTFTSEGLIWDLMIEDSTASIEFRDINFAGCPTSGGTITLTINNGEGVASTSW